jgi:hypothetical protein
MRGRFNFIRPINDKKINKPSVEFCDNRMEKNKKIWQAVIASLCVVYILLRLWRLTDSCLWFDEIFSVHAAEHDWQDLFGFVAQDLIHPPLFYSLLKIWIAAFGESLFCLRLFPVLFSALALVPFYFLCRRLKLNYSTIALAFAFLAVNGALIKYAQEVRMYSVLLFFSLLSLWLFARFFDMGKSFTALTIVNVLLIYTHYFGWLVVLAEIVAIAVLQREKIKQIFLMTAIAAASFAPWAFAVWQAKQTDAQLSQNLGWADNPDAQTVFQFALDLLEPFYFQATNVDTPSVYFISAPLLLIFTAASIFYLTNRKNESADGKGVARLLLVFCAVPILIAFAASWLLPFSIWGARHLIIIFAPSVILAAFIVGEIKNIYLKACVLILIFWLTSMAFLLQATSENKTSIICAWENLAADLRLETDNNSATNAARLPITTKVFLFEDAAAYPFWFALRGEPENRFQIVKVGSIDGLKEDAAYFLPRGFEQVQTGDETALQGERFFIAYRAADWNESVPPLRNLIENGYKIGAPQVFEAQGLKAFLVSVEK